jgi:hypothetical protein
MYRLGYFDIQVMKFDIHNIPVSVPYLYIQMSDYSPSALID